VVKFPGLSFTSADHILSIMPATALSEPSGSEHYLPLTFAVCKRAESNLPMPSKRLFERL
jgi:hypothetical protein